MEHNFNPGLALIGLAQLNFDPWDSFSALSIHHKAASARGTVN